MAIRPDPTIASGRATDGRVEFLIRDQMRKNGIPEANLRYEYFKFR